MKHVEELSDFLSILADETRLGILYLLKEGDLVSKEIQDRLGKAQSTISQHLKILYQANIISYQQEGSVKTYFIKDYNLFKILKNFRYYLMDKKKESLNEMEDEAIMDTLK